MEITLRDKMLLEIGIIPKSMKYDAAEAGAGSQIPVFNYYRCPLCGTTYHRPFGERKNRPIRRCLKCGKVVTMEIAPNAITKDGGPGSGNFGHKGVEGQLGGSAMGTGDGVDTIQAVAAKLPKAKIEEPGDKTKKISKPFFEKIGYGGKPSVLSDEEFDAAESDYPVQYRGISSPDAYDKVTGDEFYVGSGANGDGANTTPDRATAEHFAGEGGGVVEIKLDKSAKVISDTELMEKIGEFRRSEPAEGVDKTAFYHLTSDPGCIAASLGYDAISDSSTGWLNIVNRGKMIVRKQG